jgi:hypothetical protein
MTQTMSGGIALCGFLATDVSFVIGGVGRSSIAWA